MGMGGLDEVCCAMTWVLLLDGVRLLFEVNSMGPSGAETPTFDMLGL